MTAANKNNRGLSFQKHLIKQNNIKVVQILALHKFIGREICGKSLLQLLLHNSFCYLKCKDIYTLF